MNQSEHDSDTFRFSLSMLILCIFVKVSLKSLKINNRHYLSICVALHRRMLCITAVTSLERSVVRIVSMPIWCCVQLIAVHSRALPPAALLASESWVAVFAILTLSSERAQRRWVEGISHPMHRHNRRRFLKLVKAMQIWETFLWWTRGSNYYNIIIIIILFSIENLQSKMCQLKSHPLVHNSVTRTKHQYSIKIPHTPNE